MPATWLKIAYFYLFSTFFPNLRILLMNIHDQQKPLETNRNQQKPIETSQK